MAETDPSSTTLLVSNAKNLLYVSIGLLTVLLVATIVILALTGMVLDKAKDKLSSKDKNHLYGAMISAGVLLAVGALIIGFYYIYDLHSKLKVEDAFLTDATRISTAPISSQDLRNKFGKYLGSKIKGFNAEQDGSMAVKSLAGYLGQNYSGSYEDLRDAYNQGHMPFPNYERVNLDRRPTALPRPSRLPVPEAPFYDAQE